MSLKWIRATTSYALRAAEKQAATGRVKKEPLREDPKAADRRRNHELVVRTEASALQSFLESIEGRDALLLLAASERRIIFGENKGGGGFTVVHFMDGTGLRQSFQSHGMSWVFGKREFSEPEITPIDSSQAVASAMIWGGHQPWTIMPWLDKELDKIADAAE